MTGQKELLNMQYVGKSLKKVIFVIFDNKILIDNVENYHELELFT